MLKYKMKNRRDILNYCIKENSGENPLRRPVFRSKRNIDNFQVLICEIKDKERFTSFLSVITFYCLIFYIYQRSFLIKIDQKLAAQKHLFFSIVILNMSFLPVIKNISHFHN